jgi:hypothetical protein
VDHGNHYARTGSDRCGCRDLRVCSPRKRARIAGGSLVAVIALATFFASWRFGVETVNSARYWTENVDEYRKNLGL